MSQAVPSDACDGVWTTCLTYEPPLRPARRDRRAWRPLLDHAERESALAADLVAASGIEVSGAGQAGLLPYLRALGIEVREVDLPLGMTGRTSMESGPVIEVAAATSPNRRLFTVAHELAHVLVEEASFNRAFRNRLPTAYAPTERLCDRIAGQLLLPQAWMSTAGTLAIRSASVGHVSMSMHVSKSAFFQRSHELGWHALTVKASKDSSGRWRIDSSSGAVCGIRPFDLPLQSVLDAVAEKSVKLFGRGAKVPVRVPEGVYGEISRRENTAWIWLASVEDAGPLRWL